ncbi:MAG: hypothetical protein ACK6AD_04300 [Cyanobacteriota bacterium]|jgi:hypothetical protein
MLIDFQQAQAEITASPGLCSAILREPSLVDQRWRLTPRERHQLLAMAKHPGMSCGCSLYRANRISPLRRHLPRTFEALGDQLAAVLSAYWEAHPWPYRYGSLESQRFCQWLAADPQPAATAASLAGILMEERDTLQRDLQRFLAGALKEDATSLFEPDRSTRLDHRLERR